MGWTTFLRPWSFGKPALGYVQLPLDLSLWEHFGKWVQPELKNSWKTRSELKSQICKCWNILLHSNWGWFFPSLITPLEDNNQLFFQLRRWDEHRTWLLGWWLSDNGVPCLQSNNHAIIQIPIIQPGFINTSLHFLSFFPFFFSSKPP